MMRAAPALTESSAGLLGDTPLRDYSRKLSSFNSFAKPELRALIASVGLGPGMRILDAGCGTGEALPWLLDEVNPSGSVVGIDLAAAHVDGKIRGQTSGGSVECGLVGINRGLSATTSGGSIEVTLPRATTANLEAITSGGSITSELPVAITEPQEGHLKGPINGGGEQLTVQANSGNVTIHASK